MRTLSPVEMSVADALRGAAAIALHQQAEFTRPIHLLLGALIFSDTNQALLTSKAINRRGLDTWREKIKTDLLLIEDVTPPPDAKLQRILEAFITQSRPTGRLTELIMMRCLVTSNDRAINRYLGALKLTKEELLDAWKLPQRPEKKKAIGFTEFLEDLSDKVRTEAIQPIAGRENDTRWLINVLCQYRKKNAILIGPPGVGKTAIVENLALLISQGKVPQQLQGKRIFSLDVGALVAGTKLRGQFEERLRNLIQFLKQQKDIILFIDEMHTIMSAGDSRQGHLNAANMLKPPLARGEIMCIGATTPDDVKPIERDSAFQRRFQFRFLDALSSEDTIQAMQAEAKRLQAHYKISYTKGGIRRVHEVAREYFPHLYDPDKSLTLLDAVGSYIHNKLGRDVVNTHAVNTYLRDQSFREGTEVQMEIANMLTEMFPAEEKLRQQILVEVAAYQLHLRTPSVLGIISQNPVALSEFIQFLSERMVNRKPLCIEGEDFVDRNAVSALKGGSPVYDRTTILDSLRYTPHQVVFIRNLHKADPLFQEILATAIKCGEITDMREHVIPLRHAFFLLSVVTDSALGFAVGKNEPKLPPQLSGIPTVEMPKPNPAWVQSFLRKRLEEIVEKVRTKIRVTFSEETLRRLCSLVQQGTPIDEVIHKVEDTIVKAHARHEKIVHINELTPTLS